jgi:hypothetical protein
MPGLVGIVDFFAQAFDMDIDGAGVADEFIAPDLFEELLAGKDAVGR